MHHGSNLTRDQLSGEIARDKGRGPSETPFPNPCANLQKRKPHTVIGASSYVRVNTKEGWPALLRARMTLAMCTDLTKGATWVAGLNGPLRRT
jgi:hypothetical protein